MTPDQQAHLLELFDAYSQDTLTEAEHRELQAVLRADVEARRLWFLHQDVELGLKCLIQPPAEVSDHSGNGATVGTRPASAGVVSSKHFPIRLAALSQVSELARRNPRTSVAALLCLSATVALGFYIWRLPPNADHAGGHKFANTRLAHFVVESPTHGAKFTVPAQNGKVVALHFLLKTECPNCLTLAHDYAELAPSHPEVLHLFLKPDSTGEIKVWAGKISQKGLKTPPVIYRDPDARLAKEFGIPDGYKFHGQAIHYPALVALDSNGKELFRYIGKNNTDRMEPEEFIAKLAMITDHQ